MMRKLILGLATGLLAAGLSFADTKPAEAGATIQFGFGFGAPYVGGGYYPYSGPRRVYRDPYYRPRYYAPDCWTERRRVVKYNRYGEPYYVVRRVRVCR
jgi:hypothetical protein